ncbi:hypothetical protein CRUP_001807, partial [Coryphaenoides rupestris]
HHTVYVGVHVPKSFHRRRRHRRKSGHRERRDRNGERGADDRDKSDGETADEATASILKPHVSPAERIRFILGEEDDGPPPPQLFTELDELLAVDGHEMEWKETARWEVGGAGGTETEDTLATRRKPHPHRPRAQENGPFVVLKPDLKEKVMYTLLRKHRHQTKKSNLRSLADIGKTVSSASRLFSNQENARSPVESPGRSAGSQDLEDPCEEGFRRSSMGHPCSPSATPRNLTSNSLSDFSDKAEKDQLKNKFMKKLPRDAEASNVLVGEVDFLETPFVAFIRLQQAVMLGALTEVFHDIAYKAKDRQDLLAGIEEFLDEVIVLPPGEWDPDITDRAAQVAPLRGQEEATVVPAGGAEMNWGDAHNDGRGGGVRGSARFCGGLILDIKRKLPFFASDFYDALHIQSLSTILFIYLGTVTNAITFGGLLGDATENMQQNVLGSFCPAAPPWIILIPSWRKRRRRRRRRRGGEGITRPLNNPPRGRLQAPPYGVLWLQLGLTQPLLFCSLECLLGVLESFLGTALTGTVFCLLAGQPLTILSSTGPVLVFERLLFTFSKDYGFDYLEFRLWIGLWSGVFCLVLVATDASFLVQYFTRFTEEGFSALISFIFIYDAFKKMLSLAHHHPINTAFDANLVTLYDCRCTPPPPPACAVKPENVTWASLDVDGCLRYGGVTVGETCGFVPDITLMSFILFFGTYACSMCLKKFKTSRFFPTTVRKLISDFAIILTILLFCGVDALVGVNTPKLIVPSEFKPTSHLRGWLISPFGGNPWWVYLAATLPALLVTILIFMDQQITAVIVNRKEHKLKKGAGYHLDLFWVAVLIIVCSFTGLPWYVAATVISIAHIDSLKMETKTSAPGEMPKFLGVREQRVTGIVVFILTGLSVFMAPILKFIPMPVLYGVFLYMGVASLNGVQFMDRLQLLLMPAKHQPDLIYLRHVPQRRIHLFTFIQALCLALLWVLKSTVAAIVFPVMILALVAVRKAMDYMFSQHDLSYLDDVIPEKDKKKKEDEKKKKHKKKGSIDSELEFQSEYPSHENIPSIKISMDTMEKEPMLATKFDSEYHLDRDPYQKSVPQIRIERDAGSNGFCWRSKGPGSEMFP